MSKETVTYLCGHSETRQLYGKTSDRARKAAWLGSRSKCPACEAVDRAEKSRVDAAANAADGLPPLDGSEKQIAWAESIRRHMVSEAKRCVDTLLAEHPDADGERLAASAMTLLRAQESADWWIDRAGQMPLDVVEKLAADIKVRGMPAVPAPVIDDDDVILSPVGDVASELVATIAVASEAVTLSFPERNDRVIEIAKAAAMKWHERTWNLPIDATTGPAEHRAADLVAALVAGGFRVRCKNSVIRSLAVVGGYPPRRWRWIIRAGEGKVSLKWGAADDFHEVARRLPGARYDYDRRRVVIPADAFEALQDFAERYDFAITPSAGSELDAARKRRDTDLRIGVNPPEPTPATIASTAIPTLTPTETDIDDDLRDDL